MSPLTVLTNSGSERFSKTKVTGLLMALIAVERLAESMFNFHLLPADVESKVGGVVDLLFTIGGFAVIIFRGKKG